MDFVFLPILLGIGLLAALFDSDGGGGNDEAAESDDVVTEPVVEPDADANLILLGDDEDSFTGGNLTETVIGNDQDNLIDGAGNHDELQGRAGDDTLLGGNGIDILSGNLGDDLLYGGGWDDALNGGSGQDVLEGGNGKDTLFGDAGIDTLFGGAFHDLLVGGSGSDVLEGGNGDDTLIGGNWDVAENLGDDPEVDFAGYLIDQVQSGAQAPNPDNAEIGFDEVSYILDGSDSLSGGDGNDTMFVGTYDTANGGGGSDTFVVRGGTSGWAVIEDFQSNNDAIAISYTPTDGSSSATVAITSLGPDAYVAVNGDTVARLVGAANNVSLADVTLLAVQPGDFPTNS